MSLPRPDPRAALRPDGPLIDSYGREHTYLRLSVTDRCNYRCTYCMPAEGLNWMPREHLLSYEEILKVVISMAGMGLRRVRLTGGEPTVRRGLEELIGMLNAVDGIDEISMTTNGHLFTKQAERLAAAGLRRINLSLDSLDPVQFRDITRGGDLARVLEAVKTAIAVGLTPVKINAVVVKGVNEDQIEAMIDYFSLMSDFVELRFIEWMPFDGNGARRLHVPEQSLRRRIAGRYGLERSVEPVIGGGPAVGWTIPSTGLKLGFISPMTEHFCHLCNRLRLSADGNLRTCLSRENNPNIRDLLRGGASEEELGWTIRKMVFGKVAGHEVDTGVSRAFEGIMTQVGG